MEMYRTFMTNYSNGGTLQDAVTRYLIQFIGVTQEQIDSIKSIMLKDADDQLVTHTVTYMVDGKIYQQSKVFDGEYIKDITPVYFDRHLECWLLDNEPFDKNIGVTKDLVLVAKFKQTVYEDYDVITVRDLELGETFVPVAGTRSFVGTSNTRSKMFEFDYEITATDGSFDDGVHIDVGSSVWECKAHVWFSSLNSIHIFVEGISSDGTMHPAATYNRHLEYGKTYRISVGVLIPLEGEYQGKKIFIVLIDGELLSLLPTTADISSGYNIGIAGTEGILKSVENKKQVSFIASDGSLIENVMVTRGNLVSEPDKPSLDNKVFLGWFDELGNLWNFESNKVLKDVKLFAKFGDKTINAVVIDEYFMEISHGYKVKIGIKVSEIELPLVSADNLEFEGWYNGSTKLNDSDVITEDMDLICKFKVNEVKPIDPVEPVEPVEPEKPIDPVPTKKGCKSTFFPGTCLIGLSLLFGTLIIKRRKERD